MGKETPEACGELTAYEDDWLWWCDDRAEDCEDGRRMKHTFVVCAYGESPYLRQCLESLRAQTVRSEILMITSTPNDKIQSACEEHGLKLRVNHGKSGIADDWNFALQQAKTPLVTLAHQDDIYQPDYARQILYAWKKNRDAIILFSDYQELRIKGGVSEDTLGQKDTADSDRHGWKITESGLVRTKRIMMLPLRIAFLQRSRWIRRRVFSLGNAICCPSVTYVKKRMPGKLFIGNMKSNIDWQAWELLSRKKGCFVYIPQKLMLHRIHGESTTAGIVNEHARREEDLYMLRKFWPGKMPELIWRLYGKNERYQ